MERDPKTIVLALCLLAIGAASAGGLLGGAADAIGVAKLVEPSREYLRFSSEQSVRFLVGLSAAKTGLAVIEGSSANVSAVLFGVSVQVGDVVKALYDAVDYAWTAVLLGCSILFALRYLLEAGFRVGQYTLAVTGLCLGAYLLLAGESQLRSLLRRTFRFTGGMTLVLWVGFPVALVLASLTSRTVTAQVLLDADHEVQSLTATTRPESPASITTTLDAFKTYLIAKADDVTRALATIIAAYALDCVVFPFLFAGLVLGLGKKVVGLT